LLAEFLEKPTIDADGEELQPAAPEIPLTTASTGCKLEDLDISHQQMLLEKWFLWRRTVVHLELLRQEAVNLSLYLSNRVHSLEDNVRLGKGLQQHKPDSVGSPLYGMRYAHCDQSFLTDKAAAMLRLSEARKLHCLCERVTTVAIAMGGDAAEFLSAYYAQLQAALGEEIGGDESCDDSDSSSVVST